MKAAKPSNSITAPDAELAGEVKGYSQALDTLEIVINALTERNKRTYTVTEVRDMIGIVGRPTHHTPVKSIVDRVRAQLDPLGDIPMADAEFYGVPKGYMQAINSFGFVVEELTKRKKHSFTDEELRSMIGIMARATHRMDAQVICARVEAQLCPALK